VTARRTQRKAHRLDAVGGERVVGAAYRPTFLWIDVHHRHIEPGLSFHAHIEVTPVIRLAPSQRERQGTHWNPSRVTAGGRVRERPLPATGPGLGEAASASQFVFGNHRVRRA